MYIQHQRTWEAAWRRGRRHIQHRIAREVAAGTFSVNGLQNGLEEAHRRQRASKWPGGSVAGIFGISRRRRPGRKCRWDV